MFNCCNVCSSYVHVIYAVIISILKGCDYYIVLSSIYIILVLLQVKTAQTVYLQNSSSPNFPSCSLIQVL